MIEGKLGHHFQVDEMRHTASAACPAFTACRTAERCCCPCTSRPPCPALTADKKDILAEAAFSQDWELSLPVYVVYKGAGKSLCLSDSTFSSCQV